MATIVAKARGENADFIIREVYKLDLIYHKMRTGALQLVLPKSLGLRLHVMLELHSSLYYAHLGVRKTTAALQQCFWQPKLPKYVAAFVKAARFASASKMLKPCLLASCNRWPCLTKNFSGGLLTFLACHWFIVTMGSSAVCASIVSSHV